MRHLLRNAFTTFVLFSFLVLICCTTTTVAQSLNLHINCNGCDMTYIRQELTYVNHVRDQAQADVQALINRIGNGSGGSTYELRFTGRNRFNSLQQELKFDTSPTQTNDEIRRGLLRRIEAGLLPFLLDGDMADNVTLTVQKKQAENTPQQQALQIDPWNSWIYEVWGEADLSKETSRSSMSGEIGASADRVTENWRIRSRAEMNYSENQFKSDEKEIIVVRKHNYLNGSIVRSLGTHWSTGVFSGISHNTYSNLDLSYYLRPALEYSLFPYREVIRREITVAYSVGLIYNDYLEQTIYEKSQESLMNQSFLVRMQFRQPWGDISSTLEASNYLHDFSKNSIELDTWASIRVYKGLAVRLSAEMDLVRDQITLPAGESSLEDILLRQRQIATDFEMELGVGISYTFGSAFNNVVNTRL